MRAVRRSSRSAVQTASGRRGDHQPRVGAGGEVRQPPRRRRPPELVVSAAGALALRRQPDERGPASEQKSGIDPAGVLPAGAQRTRGVLGAADQARELRLRDRALLGDHSQHGQVALGDDRRSRVGSGSSRRGHRSTGKGNSGSAWPPRDVFLGRSVGIGCTAPVRQTRAIGRALSPVRRQSRPGVPAAICSFGFIASTPALRFREGFRGSTRSRFSRRKVGPARGPTEPSRAAASCAS
jgi:hypothetical protein